MILSHGQWLEKPCIAQFLWRHDMWEADNDCPNQALYQLGTQYPGPVSQPKELLTVAPTRPCINYSVSLEAVVWDGEQEDVFQYEPVRSKMIRIIRMMITYILGYEENSAKNLWLSKSWAWILFRQKSGHWTRCQTPLTAWRCLISLRLDIGNRQLPIGWTLAIVIANRLDIGHWHHPLINSLFETAVSLTWKPPTIGQYCVTRYQVCHTTTTSLREQVTRWEWWWWW